MPYLSAFVARFSYEEARYQASFTFTSASIEKTCIKAADVHVKEKKMLSGQVFFAGVCTCVIKHPATKYVGVT